MLAATWSAGLRSVGGRKSGIEARGGDRRRPVGHRLLTTDGIAVARVQM